MAEHEIEHLIGRGYLGYRFALVGSGAMRILSKPEEVTDTTRAWLALAIDATSALVGAAAVRSRRTARLPAMAALEATSGSVMGLLALGSMTDLAWERGAAWSCGSNDWRASGASVTSASPAARLGGFAAQWIPYIASSDRPEGRSLRRHMLLELTSFAALGMALTDLLRWRARQIDERAAELAAEQTRLALTVEEVALRRDVLSATIDALVKVRDALSTDGDRARAQAESEERRLRSWLEANAAVLSSAPKIDTTGHEADAEDRIRQVARIVEAGMRLASTGLTLATLGATSHRSTRSVLAWAAISFRGVASLSLLGDSMSPHRRQRLLAGADFMAVAAVEALQVEIQPGGEPTGWLQAYCVACAASAGTIDGDAELSRWTAAAIAAVRSGSRLTGAGSPLRRGAAAGDELISLASAALLGRWLISTGVTQARALTTASTALAMERSRFQLEARRLRHQAFVHDGAVQVLLWVGKDDLDDDQLRHWIDQELPRLEAVVHGSGGVELSLASSVAQAIADLSEGFRHLGMTIELAIGSVPGFPPDMGLAIVEILNEALTNVFRHTAARSARCELTTTNGALVARVTDDGTGHPPVEPGSGMGTRTMMDLAQLIGATLEWSATPSGGTAVTFTLPLRGGSRAVA